MLLETAATNTGESVQLSRARVAEVMDIGAIRSVVVIGKECSTRRYKIPHYLSQGFLEEIAIIGPA